MNINNTNTIFHIIARTLKGLTDDSTKENTEDNICDSNIDMSEEHLANSSKKEADEDDVHFSERVS